MIKKYYLYLKLTAATCFRNRTRIVLTLIGICIGLIVFLLGNAAISGYMKQLYRSADAFAENTYVLTGYPQDVAWFEEKLRGKADCRKRSYSVLDSFSATPFYSYQSHMISNSVHLIGTEADMLQDPIPGYAKNASLFAGNSTLLRGRDLNADDLAQNRAVCLLEQSTAMLLFQTEDVVGRNLHLESDAGYLDLEVVGIMQDNFPTQSRNFTFNKLIREENDEPIRNTYDVYIPLSLVQMLSDNAHSEPQQITLLRSAGTDAKALSAIVSQVLSEAGRLSKAVTVKSKEMLIRSIQETQKEFDIIRTIVTVFLFAVSGFIILTVFLFAIKERIYEIGVRRAVGASSFSILTQFMLEGILLSGLAAGISIAFSVFLSNFLTYFIRDINYIDFTMILQKELLLGTAAISVLQGIIFSFLPAVIASRIRPTEAIRWD